MTVIGWLFGTRRTLDQLYGAIRGMGLVDERFWGITIHNTFIGVARARKPTPAEQCEAVVLGLTK